MSVNFELCPASVKQMVAINNTLKPYGTPYLLPNTDDLTCLFGYICNEKACPHYKGKFFESIKYPNAHQCLKKNTDNNVTQKIAHTSEEICAYYGLDKDVSDEFCKKEAITGMMKHIWDDNRTLFSREYDRIICTAAFRRLQYKTQVMVNSASDDQRTRLLHSLEVQKIAKKLALGVGANWELAETIAIAHDIGHTPFGHEGESSIKCYLQEKNCGAFSHALQSVKVLNELTEHPVLSVYDIQGLGLSAYVLEGVLKHDSDTFTDGMQNGEFKLQYDVDALCQIVGIDIDPNAYKEQIGKHLNAEGFGLTEIQIPQVLIGSVESQIVAWADKIAYLGHDWEEFIDTGLLEKMMSRINDMVLLIGEIATRKKNSSSNDEEAKALTTIWKSLQNINSEYSNFDQTNSNYCADVWGNVFGEIQTIIAEINKIEKNCIEVTMENADDKSESYYCHKYFSAHEYAALKNYFIVTASWVNLLDIYPKTYGFKNDPIYIFYTYLTKIRSNVITPRVTERIIKQTKDYVEDINPNGTMTRADYLIHCNKLWAHKYAHVNRMMLDSKKARKYLKKSIKTCFLVGFHDKVERNNPTYIVGYVNNKLPKDYSVHDSGYDFDSKYNCMLYINDCIMDEFIRSTRVKFMKHTAQEIITTLLDYYYDHPDMLPFVYRKRYNKHQYALAMQDNIPEVANEDYTRHAHICKARAAADYVADMTDRMAKLKYDEIKSSDTKWSNTYANKLT